MIGVIPLDDVNDSNNNATTKTVSERASDILANI